MRNSYPFKIGTKLDNSVCPDYRPDGRVRPGHLAGLQTDHFFTHLAWAQSIDFDVISSIALAGV